MTSTISEPAPDSGADTEAAAEALAGRLLVSGVEALELYNVYLGHALGLYRALAGDPPQTSAALAGATGLDERYVREWLQAQTISGFVVGSGPDLSTATFSLPPGGREVLVEETSPGYLTPLAQALAATGITVPALVEAFRTGCGVPYAAYGPEAVSAQAALNRPAFTNELVSAWLPAIPQVAARLADPTIPTRVADLGCGAGWASIALAQAHPHLRIDGYDADEASIAMARRNAAEAGVADRVRFEVRDLAEPAPDGPRYDVAFLFECVHDFGYPERVLRTVRESLAADGTLIVMDEAVDDRPVVPTEDPVQRFFANVSPLWCLPQGRVDEGAHPVGTVMRPEALRELAESAGFSGVDVLPIEHPFWRFYRLR